MTCCNRSSAIFKIATLLLLVGIIVNAVGFASPFWSTRVLDFEGLWQICTGGACVDTIGNALSNADWFVANQVLQAVGIILALIAAVISFVFLCCICINRVFNACGIIVTIHVILAGILLVIGLTVYGVFAHLENSSATYLFSYWLVLAAAILYFLSGILFSLAVDRDWKHKA